MKHLFVEITGQQDNIGDSLLRRGMVDSVRHPDIQMHIRIGESPAGYVSGAGVTDDDVTYRNRSDWVSNIKVNRGQGATSFLANAGEVIRVRGPRYMGPRLHLALLPMRRRGGALIHTGVGVRDLHTHRSLAKINPLRFFDLVTWRDQPSRDYAAIGEVQPDWGFATGSGLDPVPSSARDVLAVSVRGDREAPTDTWIDAVRALAKELKLQIVTYSQVQRDSSRAHELAQRLDAAETVSWLSDDHAEQESRVRDLLRRSRAVVSDRVHGLIMGATEGAYPLGLPPRPNEKSRRTLAPVGFHHHIASIERIEERAESLVDTDLAAETYRAVDGARTTLDARAKQIINLVLSR